MKDVLAKLGGGDRRSIGQSEEVVRYVSANPDLFDDLFTGLFNDDLLVRMRAADAIEKLTRQFPGRLSRWKQTLLRSIAHCKEKEVRWHVAQLIPRLNLTAREQKAAVRILMSYLNDESSIVKTSSMQSLVDLALRNHRLLPEVKPLIEHLSRTGTPAMRSRGRKLLNQLQGFLAPQ